ncbi:hypothetical protein JHK86_009574 [Glycine max]|nr:hypothetical protein JHK86_009574 [Glycine max]
MDPNIDLDGVLDQMIDEELEDNTNEEIITLILESQQQLHGNTTRHSQRRKVVRCNREEGHDRLLNDYFSENPMYTDIFRRRFRMRRHVFLRIVDALNNHDEYFQMRVDALCRKGLSPLQKGDHHNPTIIIEVVTSQDLWIRHAFFGTAGSNNDITVLNGSNVFDEVLSGRAPAMQFTVNRTQYNMRYYLADDIYPDFVTFNIIYACIILYNMIVEDKPDTYQNNIDYNSVGNNMSTLIGAHPSMRSTYFQRRAEVHYKQRHHQLQADLVEYIWEHFRNENNN